MKDKQIEELIQLELERQQNTIELIASENLPSKDVMEATGSILTAKYCEGRLKTQEELAKEGIVKNGMCWLNPNNPTKLGEHTPIAKRYYNGCEVIDQIEMLACDRFRELFNTN